MSLRLNSPKERTLVDTHLPITAGDQDKWRGVTEGLAKKCFELAHQMTSKIDEMLDGQYRVTLSAKEETPQFSFVILSDPSKIDQEPEQKYTSKLTLVLEHEDEPSLHNHIGIEVQIDKVKVTAISAPMDVTIAEQTFTVRHCRKWYLWDYNYTKKHQGYSEEDYPGCRWDPDFNETLIIIGGDYAGQDLFGLMQDFNRAIYELQYPEEDFSDFRVRFAKKHDENQKVIFRQTKAAVFEASGITFHASAGEAALDELAQLCNEVSSFLSRN